MIKSRVMHSIRSIVLLVISLGLATLACEPIQVPGPSPTPEIDPSTIAALATSQAHLLRQISGLEQSNADLATQVARQNDIISYLATRIPSRPTFPVHPTMTPYRPVYGSVLIEGGQCCIGGIAGDTIEIGVAFEATSPKGEVTEMRVLIGGLHFSEDEMAYADWEDFIPYKTYSIQVAINWVGFYVTVQYRDELGNLSLVYYDDISVEGHPASPTPRPTP